jgi:hypothetical protein
MKMQTTRATKSTRFAIDSAGLRAPQRVEVKAGHGYYMGASSSPNYALVLSVTDSQIVYATSYSLERVVCQRWIAEDLIATAGETVKRRAIDDKNAGSPCRDATWNRTMAHGAAADPSSYDRVEVTLLAVGEADHYGAAKAYGVLTGWGGTDANIHVVECAASEAQTLAADVRFKVVGFRTIKACPTA